MMLLLYDYYYILDINGGYFLVQVIYLRLWNNQLKVRKTSMIFAQNNLINQSIIPVWKFHNLPDIADSMLEAQSRPKPCPFLLIDQVFTFTPGARRIWSTRVRLADAYKNKHYTWKRIVFERKYICNQLNLPLRNCHSVIHIFFLNNIFSNANLSFFFPKFYYFKPYYYYIRQRSHSCFW